MSIAAADIVRTENPASVVVGRRSSRKEGGAAREEDLGPEIPDFKPPMPVVNKEMGLAGEGQIFTGAHLVSTCNACSLTRV